MSFGPIGFAECLILLGVIAVVVGLAFRTGYFRGRDRR